MTAARPPSPACRLSVVVASAHGAEPLERCLATLVPQIWDAEVEVIVAGDVGEAQRGRFPTVTFLPFPPGTAGPVLWGAGIARTRGARVAITETRTVPSATWVADVLATQDPTRPLIGGAVEPSEPRSLTSWGAYFCDYGAFMRPLRRGPAEALPGNNTVFDRALLDRATELTSPAFWKTYWCQALAAEGVPLAADPTVVVYDAKTYRLVPLLVRRFHHGRCFAGMRTAGLRPTRRALYAAASPLLPALFLSRVARRVVPKRRYRSKLLASAPVIVLAVAAWSLGEAVGYVAGAGASCDAVV